MRWARRRTRIFVHLENTWTTFWENWAVNGLCSSRRVMICVAKSKSSGNGHQKCLRYYLIIDITSVNRYIVYNVQIACETFCLDINEMSDLSIKAETLTIDNIRFSANETSIESLDNLLIKYHSKKNVRVCHVKREPINLHGESSITARSTVLVEILTNGVRMFI